MPLYIVGQGKDRFVDPERVGPDHSKILGPIRDFHHNKTFDRMSRTAFDFVTDQKPSKASQLVYASTASLFGHDSQGPNHLIRHLWDGVGAVWNNNEKMCRLSVGAFLLWAVASQNDTWLGYRTETGGYDYAEDKEIYFMAYWIDNNFIPMPGTPGPASAPLNIKGLASTWGATILR